MIFNWNQPASTVSASSTLHVYMSDKKLPNTTWLSQTRRIGDATSYLHQMCTRCDQCQYLLYATVGRGQSTCSIHILCKWALNTREHFCRSAKCTLFFVVKSPPKQSIQMIASQVAPHTTKLGLIHMGI